VTTFTGTERVPFRAGDYLQGFLVPSGFLSLFHGLENVHQPSTKLKSSLEGHADRVIAGEPP
jgi:hypothetical protein